MDDFHSILVLGSSSCTMLGCTAVMCVYVLVLIIDQIHERLYGKRMYYRCHISLELHMLFCTIILELENCKAITNFTIKKAYKFT
jgi:hypothetical protein